MCSTAAYQNRTDGSMFTRSGQVQQALVASRYPLTHRLICHLQIAAAPARHALVVSLRALQGRTSCSKSSSAVPRCMAVQLLTTRMPLSSNSSTRTIALVSRFTLAPMIRVLRRRMSSFFQRERQSLPTVMEGPPPEMENIDCFFQSPHSPAARSQVWARSSLEHWIV